jgi:hypothetical protein
MNIDDAIHTLQEVKKNGTKNLIIAWWDSECFNRKEGKDWKSICNFVDNNMDWSSTHEGVDETIRYYKKHIDTPEKENIEQS